MCRLVVAAFAIQFAEAAVAGSESTSDGPWWTGHLITVLATVLGALMIVWQIGRQRRNEIEAQRENHKLGLRLHVYQEFSSKLLHASDTVGSAGMYAFCIAQHMKLIVHGNIDSQAQPVSDRAKTFLDLDSIAQREVADVVLLLEKYLIVHPDLDVFRMALSSAAHDLRAAFPSLFEFMVHRFPMDSVADTGSQIINVHRLSHEECEGAEGLAMSYYDRASDAQCFLSDIQTELQQLFLGPLFPNKPPRRVPADPSKRVLSLEPSAVRSLRQYFLKNTDWGRAAVATSMEVHKKFHG